ncbi:MAG: toxin-antitoxin system TumE family protein [Acetobacteraceae bacterium]
MKAELLFRQRVELRRGTFKEIIVWLLPRRLRGSSHPDKYRMALVDAGVCVLRYDNEAGKGDHHHTGNRETSYAFTTIERLRDDFETNIRKYLDGHPDHR